MSDEVGRRRYDTFQFARAFSERFLVSRVGWKIDNSIVHNTQTLLISNHVCPMDTWLLVNRLEQALGRRVSFWARAINGKVAPVGRSQMIMIADDVLGAAKALRESQTRWQNGENILVFPEGEHQPSCGPVSSFFPGVVRLIRRLQIDEVVSIGMCYYMYHSLRPSVQIFCRKFSVNRHLDDSEILESLRTSVQDVVDCGFDYCRTNYQGSVPHPFENSILLRRTT